MYSLLSNEGNYSKVKRKASAVKYLVIHYTANDGDTARNNLSYYRNNVVKTSAHFFVDEKEVCCSVPWDYTAWHCGTSGTYRHAVCRNANSIGIELCSRKDKDGNYYFHENTLENAARFIAQQMNNFSISIDNVIRHYDVTGKLCPRPLIENKQWAKFKMLVLKYYLKVGEEMTYYETLEQIPAGEQREIVRELVNKGVIKGNDKGLHLSSDMTRLFVFLRRLGKI